MVSSKTKKTVKSVKKKIVKKTKTTQRHKVICISHKEDADGISSAALIRQAFGGDSILVDYPGQMEAIQKVCADEKLKSLYNETYHSSGFSYIWIPPNIG